MSTRVLLVGSSSGVGLQVAKTLLSVSNSLELTILARNPEASAKAIGELSSRASFLTGDVTSPSSLMDACKGMNVVICAIGARKGWCLPFNNMDSPKMVDYNGVANLANAAAHHDVKRFVLISSAFVTRPYAFVPLLLNSLFGRVMYWKLLGEKALIDAYAKKGLSYYIVRPGGLNDEPASMDGIVIDKGDKISGRISRADVARVVAECLEGDTCPPNLAFEVINAKDSTPPADLKSLFKVLHEI